MRLGVRTIFKAPKGLVAPPFADISKFLVYVPRSTKIELVRFIGSKKFAWKPLYLVVKPKYAIFTFWYDIAFIVRFVESYRAIICCSVQIL